MKYLRKLIYSDGTTPLPVSTVGVLFAVMLCNAMTLTMVFSFLPKLVKSYGTSEIDTGYKAGILASSLFFARILFSMMWGKLADSKGKKLTLIVSSVSLAMATLSFGFSFNYYWALVSRFLQGASMGIVVCAKSIISDVCDDTNIAIGMSIIIGSYSTGIIIGPSIGGFLVFPAEQYPNIFSKDSFFGRFNILLPNLIVATGLAITTSLVLLVIPKDRKNKLDEKTRLISEAESIISQYSEGSSFDKLTQSNDSCDKYVNFSMENDGREKDLSKKDFLILTERIPEIAVTGKDFKKFQLIEMKDCLLCSLLYGLYSIAALGYDEIFPLYAAAATQYNGLGFSTSQIGVALLIVSVVTIILQMLLLPRVTKKFGAINTFMFTNLLMAVFIPLTPAAGSLRNRYAFWIILLIVVFAVRLCIASGYLTINLLLNNSVESKMIGTANGIGMTTASIGRTFAPTLVGSLFSWSLTNVKDVAENKNPLGFPFNQYFPFFMLSVFSILNSIMVSRFPRYLNSKKDDADTHAQDINTKTRVTTLSVSSFKPVL